MGNYRFRLSDMIPNAWFYKLNNINNNITTNHHKKPPQNHHKPPQSHHFSHSRNPFYHSPKLSHFHNPPKIQSLHDPSTKSLSPNRKTIYKPSPKHLTESTRTLQDFFNSPITNPSPTSCTCQLNSPISHIEFDVNRTKKIGLAPETELELELAPIVTRPAIKNVKESARKPPSGVKIRQSKNTRKIKENRETASRKLYLSESLVVVKSSFDPEKDFMQSMVEMISETNVRSCKDLEELLACYLSLNSDEYHDVIIKAFEQIWFRLPDL